MQFVSILEPLPSDSHLSFSRWENVLVILAIEPEPRSSFALYEPNIRNVLRRHPRGMGVVMVVRHEKPPPEGFAEHIKALLDTYRTQLLAVSAVIEATGFAAAVQRGVGTTILAASGMNRRTHMHRSVAEAVPWLVERTQPDGYRSEARAALMAALDTLSRPVTRAVANL